MNSIKNCPVCDCQSCSEFLQLKDYFLTQENFTIVKCDNCGFRFTDPRPSENKIGSYYESEEYISHSNAKTGFINNIYQLVRNYAISRKVKLVKLYKSNGDFLDIGCGTGEFLNAISKSGFRSKGAEPNKSAREFCKNNYQLDVVEESKIDAFSENSFDVVSMWHVLEHVYNLNDRVEQIKKVLRPDGVLIVAVPNPDSYDAKKYKRYWAAYDVPRHLYHFGQKDIVTLFEKYNFDLVKTVPMKFDSYYVSLLSEKYKTGKQKIVPAFFAGFLSNISARFNQKNYSSLIYILKPKIA